MFDVDPETSEILAAVAKGATAFDPAGFPDFFVASTLREPIEILDMHADNFWEHEHGIVGATKIRTVINTSPSVNALAFQSSGFRLVSLNAGICIRVRQMMWYAVHNTKVFKARPNEQMLRPELLAESKSKFSPRLLTQPLTIRPGLNDDEYYQMLLPVAPSIERVQLALALTRCALNFIAMHEIGHIIRNQASFISENQPVLFTEMRQDLPASLSAREITLRRLFEVDADLAAADALVFQIANSDSEMWSAWTENPVEAAGLWIISAALVYWLFRAYDTPIRGRGRLHPSPITRIMALATVLVDRAPELNLSLNGDDYLVLAIGAVASAAEVWDGFGISRKPSFSREKAIRAMSEVGRYTEGLRQYGIRTNSE